MIRWIKKAKLNKKVLLGVSGGVLALAAFVIFIFMGRTTNVTKADEIPSSVTIGGKTFTAHNKLQVLEIVPDEAYDELGAIIGDAEGSVSWNDLVNKSPKGASKQSELTQFIQDYVWDYAGYMDVLTANSGFYLKFKNKNLGKVYSAPWSINLSEINYNLENLEIVSCVLDSNWQYQEYKTDNGNSIRNLFAYMIFDNIAMDDKMELKVMKANSVTISDIDSADLIYINGKSHNNMMFNLYNKYNNTSVSNSLTWTLGGIDLTPEVAFHLYLSNVRYGKSLIFGSTDKNANGSYSNIARITMLQCAIDGDTFIGDFAYTKKNNSQYAGSMGEVHLDGGEINVYLYTEAGTKKFPFSATMFTNDKAIEGKYGYAPNGNAHYYYPAYNATDGRFQSYLNRYTYVFNSDNCMTSSLSSNIGKKSDYDADGNYMGSTYDDAAVRLDKDKDKITSGNVICYILGDYDKPDIKSINVLEIQPIGVYRYNSDSDKAVVMSWFGLSSEDNVDVNIEHMSMNAFIGSNSDIWSDYDLIIVGSYTNGELNSGVWGSAAYTKGNEAYGLNGNDITKKAYEKLVRFARSGLPVVMDDSIYYGDSAVVATDTNVFGLRVKQFVSEVIDTNSVVGNITHIDMSLDNSTQKLTRPLIYRIKPEAGIKTNLPEYTGVGSALANRSQLSSVNFSGYIGPAGNYRIKIYIDRSCDSIFAEDYDSDAAELLYFAKDGSSPLRDEHGNILGVHSDGGNCSITLSLPSALSGYIGWKVEVTNMDTGLIKSKTGAFAIQSYMVGRTINVLQIVDGNEYKTETLDLEDGSAFRQCFDATTATTGLSIEVTKITKKYFNSLTTDKNEFLSNYSMLVLGLSDNYGNDNITSGWDRNITNFTSQSINAIKNYIDKGNSVLFTHDSMSYKKISGNSLVEAGNADNLNEFTRTFKSLIGLKEGYSLTDTLRFKLNSKTPFNSVNGTTSTRNTTTVAKLNKGEITEYPYSLSDKTISISETHGQYFSLELESFAGSTEPYNNDVVVWYTLAETNNNSLSGYYTYSGQDAKNNYYVYSKGNITYTSAGHSTINTNNDEMKLFVNTFIRAMLSGNALPEAEFIDATKESPTLFTKYFRTDLSAFKDKLDIEFTVTDPDLVDNIGRLTTCYLFYDKNNSDEFDSGDVIIGYFDKDGNISPNMISGKSIYSARKYNLELWSAVKKLEGSRYTTAQTNELLAEMQQKLVNNKLRIGVVAKDASGDSGFAVIKLVERDLFRLN